MTVPYPSSEPETVHLTLTPNTELAERCVDLPEIWGKTITFKNVPRNRPDYPEAVRCRVLLALSRLVQTDGSPASWGPAARPSPAT